MQPHPIPQNVTNFQFRLIGDMTLKQFGYLATGSAIAYVIFVFFSHDYPLISWPGIVLSAGLGAAFAFLPVNSRPLDCWVGAFIRAIYSPTKRVWKKNNHTFNNEPLFNSRLVTYLSGSQNPSYTKPITLATAIPKTTPDLPTTETLGKTVDLAKEAQNLQYKIIQTERNLNQIKSVSETTSPLPIDYSDQVNKALTNLQSLMSQASEIRERIDDVTKSKEDIKSADIAAPNTVRVVIPAKMKQTQLALTTFPNVISGVVKDRVGNYLEGAVAVIYDKEGLPVRALKTNKLGQFSGSTPLPNGVFTLELEKDNFTFDVLQMELTGTVLPPLIITSKN